MFRGIKRRVRPFDQILDRFAVHILRNAARQRDPPELVARVAVDNLFTRHRLAQGFRHPDRGLQICFGQDDCEFFAAEAGRHVPAFNTIHQRPRHQPQNLVADLVAV
jgi:hypothetical protein